MNTYSKIHLTFFYSLEHFIEIGRIVMENTRRVFTIPTSGKIQIEYVTIGNTRRNIRISKLRENTNYWKTPGRVFVF